LIAGDTNALHVLAECRNETHHGFDSAQPPGSCPDPERSRRAAQPPGNCPDPERSRRAAQQPTSSG
jgi:hypothetical protein